MEESRFWNVIWRLAGSENKTVWHAVGSKTETYNAIQSPYEG